MGFLRRLRGGGDAVPEWASFFSTDDYRVFIETVRKDLQRRGLAFEIGDGVVRVEGSDTEFGLTNLAQLCHTQDRSGWDALVAGHFSNLRAIEGRDLDALAADFDQVRPTLRVRLFADETMDGMRLGDIAVGRPLASGAIQALVYDFPDSTQSVAREHLAGWPPEDEVWTIATDNVRLEPQPVRETVKVDGGSFELELGDSFYVASRALRLADVLPSGATDAVFAIPNRHALLHHTVRDLTVVAALQGMLPLTGRQFDDGPGSISDQLYWWHAGEIVHLPTHRHARSVDFTPPDAFVELLNSLGEERTF